MIRWVGFDGDDTLWHSERHFVDAQQRYVELLSAYEPADGLDERILATERRNLELFGYGVKGFTLSLIETAIEVTDGRVEGHDVQTIIDIGKDLLAHPVELLDGVVETVTALAESKQLLLVTKGDLFHQETKVAASGLAEHFDAIEIVAEKDVPTYRRILQRHHIEPSEFLMIGNSVRSDVMPVVELGGHAVHHPYEFLWDVEHHDAEPDTHGYVRIEQLPDLPRVVANIDGAVPA